MTEADRAGDLTVVLKRFRMTLWHERKTLPPSPWGGGAERKVERREWRSSRLHSVHE